MLKAKVLLRKLICLKRSESWPVVRMTPEGSVRCFMCHGFIPFSPLQTVKFERHMKTDHNVFYGLEFLLAGCRMTEEERKTVNDVVVEKESDPIQETEPSLEVFVPVATLEEGEVHEDPETRDIKMERISVDSYNCDFCQKSFTLQENLQEHIGRKHPNKKKSRKLSQSKAARSVKLPRGFQKQKLISRPRKIVTPRRQSQDIPEGEGFPCKECGKEFRTQSMAEFHYTDVHVTGHFPCKGNCGKVFTSKNKMSSHWSRHCNPRNRNRLSM